MCFATLSKRHINEANTRLARTFRLLNNGKHLHTSGLNLKLPSDDAVLNSRGLAPSKKRKADGRVNDHRRFSGGETGIRTQGPFRGHSISSAARSTTLTSLRMHHNRYERYYNSFLSYNQERISYIRKRIVLKNFP